MSNSNTKRRESDRSRTSTLNKDGLVVSELAGVTIHQVSRSGDVNLLEKLLDRIPNPHLRKKKVNSKDETKLTPLHHAARYNHHEVMKILIDNGANIDAKAEDGTTPLHLIAKYKKKTEHDESNASPENKVASDDEEDAEDDVSIKCLQLLINQGADINASDNSGFTPLHLACMRKNNKIVRELLNFPRINLEARDQQEMTALHLACFNGNLKLAKLLLEAGANLRCRDKTMSTPFHLACVDGNCELAKYLLDQADTEAESYKQKQNSAFMTIDENQTEGTELGAEIQSAPTSKHKTDFGKARKSNDSRMSKRSIESNKLKMATKGKASTSKATSKLPRKSTDSGMSVLKRLTNISRKASEFSGNFTLELKSSNNDNIAEEITRGALDLLQDIDAEKNLGLHLAIENGHLALVQLCVDRAKKASWDYITHSRRSFEETCLHLAVQSNNLEIIKFLLIDEIDVNARNAALVTPLMMSCQQNAYRIVKYLIEKGANVELKDVENLTPLMISCRYGHVETVTCLLENGANVAAVDKDDKTCFMFAAEENRTEVVMMLLQLDKAQKLIEEKNKYNNTALHLASMKGHNDIVKLLLDHRALTGIKNNDDRTTLHMAALHGHDAVIPVLVGKDRSILNSGDEDSNTALHLAAIGGNLKSATALVQSGANLEIRNVLQWTPLDCASAYGWDKIVTILLESGASVQPKGKGKKHSTNTIAPLHLACQRGHVDVVNILLQWKADVTFKSSDGRNALDFAIDFGQKECVLALIKHDTWQQSMKNATFNPVTGQMLTPMRKLIMKMGDMAMIVCDQCISDNGKKPENDDYTVTFLYEYIDDMYSSTEWSQKLYQEAKEITASKGYDEYAVFDEDDILTPQAVTYSPDSDKLQSNHPLQIMVDFQSESLLLHPLVTGLLNYKWRRFGRYIYYINLLLYLAFMLLLNIYMLLLPLSYKLNWVKMIDFHNYLDQNRSATGLNISEAFESEFATASPSCIFYRDEVTQDVNSIITTSACQVFSQRNLQIVVFVFSIINLIKAAVQLFSQKLSYITFKTTFECTLYIMSLILTLDFTLYGLENIRQLSGGEIGRLDVQPIRNLQYETGLRQEWQEQLGAFGIFLSWMVLLLYIRMIPKIGIFVVMFTGVLNTFIEFFIIFAFFILAFALSFYILLGNQHSFETWHEALVKTTVMTIGELDYGDLFFSASDAISDVGMGYDTQVFSRPITLILFTVFLLVMTILIMNLLVGLAVGDITEIRQNATLESLGMQIALVLEVEFTMPDFLKKKISKRHQLLEINKYRNANFVKQILFENSNLSLTEIAEAVHKEEGESEDVRSSEDKVIVGLNLLRGRLSDMMAEQAELKDGIRGVKTLVFETKLDSKEHTKNIQKNITEKSTVLEEKIDLTRFGLVETTQSESTETRGRVDGTMMLVNALKQDIETTKRGMVEIKGDLEEKIALVQKEILSRDWDAMKTTVDRCEQDIERSKKEIVDSLSELKVILLKQKLMTSV